MFREMTHDVYFVDVAVTVLVHRPMVVVHPLSFPGCDVAVATVARRVRTKVNGRIFGKLAR